VTSVALHSVPNNWNGGGVNECEEAVERQRLGL
jgi:hypothetical protein